MPSMSAPVTQEQVKRSASIERDATSVGHEESSIDIKDEESTVVEDREVYKRQWSKKLLIIAYAVLFLVAFVETFAGDSTSGLDSYATSNFNAHALISTAAVVYKITAITTYPMLAKLADFFGRAGGFGFGVTVYTLAYVLYAACQTVSAYVCAEILYAVGVVGYRVFQQVFIADTTSLINRGLWAQLPDAVAAIPSLYVGSYIQDAFIDHSTWRWGYGVWAIVLGISCIPLVVIMWILDKRSKTDALVKIYKLLEDVPEGSMLKKIGYILYYNIDIVGFFLMVSGMALFFVPLSMTGTSSPYKWHEAKLIVMVVIGFVLFCSFLFWNTKIAKKPFVPKQTLADPTILITCLMVALDLCENSSFATYFKTMLQVSGYVSVGEATRIDASKKACVQVFSIVAGLAMKYTKRTKLFVYIGVPLVVLGHGLLVHFINTDGGVANKPLLYMAEVFIGAGRGIYQTSLQVTVQAIAGFDGIPMSTAFFLAFNSVGSLIGSCISGGVWNTVVLKKLNKYLPDDDKSKATKIYKSITVALKYEKGTETRDAIAKAYRETVQIIGWIGLGVIGPMLILMFFVRDIKLTDHVDIYQEDSDSEVARTILDSASEEKKEEAEKTKTVKA